MKIDSRCVAATTSSTLVLYRYGSAVLDVHSDPRPLAAQLTYGTHLGGTRFPIFFFSSIFCGLGLRVLKYPRDLFHNR
jgi:hypothetical protein